jgi:hypothetical protein
MKIQSDIYLNVRLSSEVTGSVQYRLNNGDIEIHINEPFKGSGEMRDMSEGWSYPQFVNEKVASVIKINFIGIESTTNREE